MYPYLNKLYMYRKLSLLTVLILLATGFTTAQESIEGVGMGEKVSVDMDRSDYGVYQSLRVYCKSYALDSCDGGFNLLSVPGTLHHYITVDDPEEDYEERMDEKEDEEDDKDESSSSGSDSEEVHHFG